jgi:hypothetical protein
VLIEYPPKADQVFHQLGPWNAMMWMLTPAAKIRFQFNKPRFNAGLTVIKTELYTSFSTRTFLHDQPLE